MTIEKLTAAIAKAEKREARNPTQNGAMSLAAMRAALASLTR